jgi:putative tryptophan/tyrosine transport system substrate-binding protein
MKRREFIALVGGTIASPASARAQQPTVPVIGFLSAGAHTTTRVQLAAFNGGLEEAGYVDGQNVVIEHRFAEGQFDRMPALADDLVRHGVAVLFAVSNAGALAAKQATRTIPIVFGIGGDPVALGLVASLNRPGSNITGIYFFTSGLEGKRLSLLHELVPKAAPIGVLVNPNYQAAENQLRDVREAAARLGVHVAVLHANTVSDFEVAFSSLAQQRAGALLVAASPFFNSQRERLVELSARHAVPAIYEWREYAEAGGLMSYGTSLSDTYRQGGVYVGRILKGTKPADLPVMQASKFELVINLKIAKVLGITVPQSLLIQANDVIE